MAAESAFPANLRAELARRRMSQAELATALGCTQTAVSYYTTGHREPSIGRLVHIADALGVSVDCLVRDAREAHHGQ